MGIFNRKHRSSSSSSSRSSDHRMSSLSGKVIMVTGGNSGLGKQSIMEFAKHEPAEIWLAARDLHRADQTVFELSRQFPTTEFNVLEMDLASLDSIRDAAETFLYSARRLDVLLLNARAGGSSSPPPSMTRDGYEGAFGVNHMGHALLTKLLMPVLLHTVRHNRNGGCVADVHVVVVSSVLMNHAPRRGIRFDKLKAPPPPNRYYFSGRRFAFRNYAQSKLANTLFARRLAREYPQLTVAAVHPGIVRTNIMGVIARHDVLAKLGRPISQACMASVQDGIQNQMWAATSQDIISGEYYSHVGVKGRMNKLARTIFWQRNYGNGLR
ncbi:hypothetical protein PG994_000541 [Apiospora phragmitis]|uniref:Uncharacterized protein n=1 Tax=Apiospora phragmitis TaxID=2905665 RepID=A0ABR1X6N9_9PEZI